MANPYTGGLQRGTKQYPAGTNVPKSGPSNSRGPATGPQRNRPAARSTSPNVGSSTYQPFAGASAQGTSGALTSGNKPGFGKFNTPIKQALAARGSQGPSRMLGGAASRVRPTNGGG